MSLSQSQKKAFRSIGHHLDPIVTVSENGLSEGVVTELERALHDHHTKPVGQQHRRRGVRPPRHGAAERALHGHHTRPVGQQYRRRGVRPPRHRAAERAHLLARHRAGLVRAADRGRDGRRAGVARDALECYSPEALGAALRRNAARAPRERLTKLQSAAVSLPSAGAAAPLRARAAQPATTQLKATPAPQPWRRAPSARTLKGETTPPTHEKGSAPRQQCGPRRAPPR